jgi:hypothetical protein
LNADGFGVTWHTDARSNFNPFVPDNPVFKTDGPLIPFVLGPHPAVYKTTIAKPWVLMAFVARNLSFFSLSGSMIPFFSLCAPTFHPRPFLPTFELQAPLRLRPPTTTPLFSGVTALCTTDL